MPAITSGKVLVTCANGYIAAWIVKAFLEQGFSVRGTVRSESKATHLRTIFKPFGDKLDVVVVVEDITKDGAFDEAVRGVDAVAVVASPFRFSTDEPAEQFALAARGITGVMRSATDPSTTVQRVVVTSSCAAVLTPNAPPKTYHDEDWNVMSSETVHSEGRAASDADKYCTWITLAEGAAWTYWKLHRRINGCDKPLSDGTKPVDWDLVVLNPPSVFGPFVHRVDCAENLNESTREWYDIVLGGKCDHETLAAGSSYVDVRDLAEAHVRAITRPQASGERIIVCAGTWRWQEFVSIAHRWNRNLPAGNTTYDPATTVHQIQYAPEKQKKLLGIEFKTMEETTKDTLEQFKERGWLANLFEIEGKAMEMIKDTLGHFKEHSWLA